MVFSIKERLGAETVDSMVASGEDRTGWEDCGWDLTKGNILQIEITDLSSFGDGLAVSPKRNWIVAVPFCVPGDMIKTRIYRHDHHHSFGDLVEVVKAGEWRNDELIKCKYFGECSGCQYQMMSYDRQLSIKRTVVEKAFLHFSGLPTSTIPPVRPTLPSPFEYGYRTKLTPHFQALPKNTRNPAREPEPLAIGFESKGRRRVMDIEQCPLATEPINSKLVDERKRIQDTIKTFKRGSTLLLRDSCKPPSTVDKATDLLSTTSNEHVCITDHKDLVFERVGSKIFCQKAGEFFQNNNSILVPLLDYVASELPSAKDPAASSYLVDAYCGSGLFSLSLAEKFTEVMGVEISEESVRFAKRNAEINGVKNASFIAGKSERIFEGLPFDPTQTTILIDPPRKGCDQLFLDQLLAFGPSSIIYVSCNVHTQARDCGVLANPDATGWAPYTIESIRGADLFPQSHHCESICVLRKTPARE